MKQTDIESIIQRYTDAEIAVLDGKSITFNGQQMTLENLSEIRKGRQEWERRLASLLAQRHGRPRHCHRRRQTGMLRRLAAFCYAGSKSQYQNAWLKCGSPFCAARKVFSPTVNRTGSLNTGPSKTKE